MYYIVPVSRRKYREEKRENDHLHSARALVISIDKEKNE